MVFSNPILITVQSRSIPSHPIPFCPVRFLSNDNLAHAWFVEQAIELKTVYSRN
jgi:hypothetical protein